MVECTSVFGNSDVFIEDPSEFAATNAIFVPIRGPVEWGIYDTGRKPILAGRYHHGPDPNMGISITPLRHPDIADTFLEPCMYAGHLHEHFGHFILSALSRLWPLVRRNDTALKTIVCHSVQPVENFFSERPWAVEMIAGLGLAPRNFITFDKPTVLKNVLVPAPGFEETNYGHHVFVDLCHKIGHEILKKVPRGRDDRPVYLSKERLRSGVRKFANETDAVERLRVRGIGIVYPETLSFPEQIALWRDRSCVASFVSSALHMSIFAPGRRVVAHSDSMSINSSFPLIDTLNGARGIYLGMLPGGIVGHASTEEFSQIAYLADPRAYADSICEAIAT